MSGSMPHFGDQKVNKTQSRFSRVDSLVGVTAVQISARADTEKDGKRDSERWGRQVLAGQHQGMLPRGAGTCPVSGKMNGTREMVEGEGRVSEPSTVFGTSWCMGFCKPESLTDKYEKR